jgi:hypothetical protein
MPEPRSQGVVRIRLPWLLLMNNLVIDIFSVYKNAAGPGMFWFNNIFAQKIVAKIGWFLSILCKKITAALIVHKIAKNC